jgi:hypothetical protein
MQRIHEHQIGVQRVYKLASTIKDTECGYYVYYNKRSIAYYVLENYSKIESILRNDFAKVVIHSDIELSNLLKSGFKKGSSTAVNDNWIIEENLDSKKRARIRRAENLLKRDGFSIDEVVSKEDTKALTDLWVEQKLADEKVFRITFSPNRYKAAVEFIDKENYSFFNIRYNGKMISSIAFFNDYENSIAYQLTYASDQSIEKVVNDQYELILWAAFADRFNNGIKIVSMGTSGGIKGLASFKKKFYTDTKSGFQYSREINPEDTIIATLF